MALMQHRQACASSRPFTAAGSAPCYRPSRRVAVRDSNTRISAPQHALATQEQQGSSFSAPAYMMAAGLAMTLATTVCTEPAVAETLSNMASQPMEQFQLAEGQEFWGNVARYGRYFITVMLGTGYVMMRPLVAAFKNPVKGILALAGVVGLVLLVKVTLDAMLGITDEPFTYVQGQF